MRQVPERQRALEQLRAVAKPYQFRIQADAEGFPIIPGRYGDSSPAEADPDLPKEPSKPSTQSHFPIPGAAFDSRERQ